MSRKLDLDLEAKALAIWLVVIAALSLVSWLVEPYIGFSIMSVLLVVVASGALLFVLIWLGHVAWGLLEKRFGK